MTSHAAWLIFGLLVGLSVAAFTWVSYRRRLEKVILTLAEKEASQDLLEQEQGSRLALLSTSLDTMDEGVAVLDRRGTVLYGNRAFRSMLGDELRTVAFQPVVEVSLEAQRSGTAEEEFESGYPSRSLRIHATQLDGQRVLVTIRDITEASLLEKVRRDFAAAASHELKTPAASIKASAETILTSVEDDPLAAKRFAERLLADSERLVHLVSDLLDLSRLESGPAEKQPIHLDAIAKQEVERVIPAAEAAGLSISISGESVTVEGDPGDIRLAASNLLDNAIRYTKAGGSITVTTGLSQGHAWLEISDTGIGIPRDQLDRIFERFYRVDQARSRESGGTGLGLALVKHIADRHGGRIEAHSELGRGSRFRLVLPSSSFGA